MKEELVNIKENQLGKIVRQNIFQASQKKRELVNGKVILKKSPQKKQSRVRVKAIKDRLRSSNLRLILINVLEETWNGKETTFENINWKNAF